MTDMLVWVLTLPDRSILVYRWENRSPERSSDLLKAAGSRMACVDWWGIFPVLRAKPCGCCLAHGLVGWWQVPYLPTISWYESNTMEIRGYQEKNGWRIWETLNRSWVTRDRLPALYFSVILRTQDFGVLWIVILCGLLVIFNVHLTLMVQSCCPWVRK